MDNLKKNFFLVIRPKYYELNVINEKYKTLFKEEFFINDKISENNLDELKNFLNENIFNLEKKFNLYIKDIYLIIDHYDFINIDVSLINEFRNLPTHFNSSHDISNIKKDVLLSNNTYQLTHMTINKFIVDKKNYHTQPKNDIFKNVFLEFKFICLKKYILNSYQDILTNYQISIKSIFNYDYVNSFRTSENDSISILAYKLNNGLNPNEISFSKKYAKKLGFFEKFFKFFG